MRILGLAQQYSVGDNVSVSCSTDLTFSRIVWLNADGEEILATSNPFSPQLNLTLNSVTADMDGTRFTCRVTSEFGEQERVITLAVGEEMMVTTNQLQGIDTVEPPNKGHFGAGHVVLFREVVLF